MAKSNSALLRDEYGDWQTNYPLALSVCQMLKNKGINPQVIIEPTCGFGNFQYPRARNRNRNQRRILK